MSEGYIFLHRKIQSNAFWTENRTFSKAEAWIDILMEVQWKPEVKSNIIGMREITTGRGQSIKSLDTWAKRWKWSRSKVRRFMVLLQELSMIRYENETQTVRLTVLNYDAYNTSRNADESQTKRKRNADESQMDTDNKENKEKKELKLSVATTSDGECDQLLFDAGVDDYTAISQRIATLVMSRKNVRIDKAKIKRWANDVRLLAKNDGVDAQRQFKAMDWYEVNAGGSYVPVIESGKAWREKFLKLEAAIERANDPFAVVTEPYRPTAASIAEAEAFEAEQRAKAEEAERSAAERKKLIEDLHARHPEWRQ